MKYIHVAGLYFSFDCKVEFLSERMNYTPFVTDQSGKDEDFLFCLGVDYSLQQTNADKEFTYTNEIGCYGVTCEKNTYEWALKRANSDELYLMQLNIATKKAYINFEINDAFTMQAADDFTRFAFIYTAAFHQTVLLHASCIKYQNSGIAFMGRSGIGKSTHSSLWLQFINESELLNDDQPAARVFNDHVTIYGTPWSGKTICYKQKEARLKAILCMEQQPFNKLIPINKIQLFTHLLSAASLIRTEKKTLKRILETLSTISKRVGGAVLQNKPEKEAALMAFDFFRSVDR